MLIFRVVNILVVDLFLLKYNFIFFVIEDNLVEFNVLLFKVVVVFLILVVILVML